MKTFSILAGIHSSSGYILPSSGNESSASQPQTDRRQERRVQQLNRPSGGQKSPETRNARRKKVFSFSGRVSSPSPPRSPQYSSLMFKGREEGDTSPLLLPLLLVTMATLLPPFPWRLPPPPVLAGGVGVVVEEAGCWSFFLLILRSLARRFWNQIFTWR